MSEAKTNASTVSASASAGASEGVFNNPRGHAPVVMDVWVSEYSDLKAHNIHEVPHDRIARDTWIWPQGKNPGSGLMRVGTAEVVITLLPRADVTKNAVLALREQLRMDRVESAHRQTQLEIKIEKLEALEYTPAATESAIPESDC